MSGPWRTPRMPSILLEKMVAQEYWVLFHVLCKKVFYFWLGFFLPSLSAACLLVDSGCSHDRAGQWEHWQGNRQSLFGRTCMYLVGT